MAKFYTIVLLGFLSIIGLCVWSFKPTIYSEIGGVVGECRILYDETRTLKTDFENLKNKVLPKPDPECKKYCPTTPEI